MLRDEDHVYLVLEYNGKCNLQEFLDKHPHMSVGAQVDSQKQKKRRLFLRVSRALQFCHSKGILHKDIKMQNVMVRPNLSVKIIDFGYSEVLPRRGDRALKFCGTPYYMPPEFIRNEHFEGECRA